MKARVSLRYFVNNCCTFSKRVGRKCRLTQTRTEQNNDHARSMHKTQFHSFFKIFQMEIFHSYNRKSKWQNQINFKVNIKMKA